MKQLFFLTLLLSGFLVSCNKEKQDPLNLTVTPDFQAITTASAQTQTFTIHGSGPSALSKFFIQVQDNSNIRTMLLDSTLATSGKQFAFVYAYVIQNKKHSL